MKRLIAIEGIDNSGKSLVAKELSLYFNIPVIKRDTIFINEALLLLKNGQMGKGCEKLIEAHFSTLSSNTYPIAIYDRFIESTLASIKVINPNYLKHCEFSDYKIDSILIIRDKSVILNELKNNEKRDWFENNLFLNPNFIDIIQNELIAKIENRIFNNDITKEQLIANAIQLASKII